MVIVVEDGQTLGFSQAINDSVDSSGNKLVFRQQPNSNTYIATVETGNRTETYTFDKGEPSVVITKRVQEGQAQPQQQQAPQQAQAQQTQQREEVSNSKSKGKKK